MALSRNNVKVLNGIRKIAGLDYQSRIPVATQGNIQETLNRLNEYRPDFNIFVDALINRVGLTLVKDISWNNPLSEFKRGMLTAGSTIQEVQVGLVKAKEYDGNREYMEREIFGTHGVDVQSIYHTVNRENYYPITVDENQLKRAFLEEGGLSNFMSSLLASPTTSDQLDEFTTSVNLFREYEAAGGFYHVRVPDVAAWDSDGADARLALRKIKVMSENLAFPSTRYNAAKMPIHAQNDEMFLFCTPEFRAAIDVEAYAVMFNLDRAKVNERIITVPREYFKIPGCQAILTTRDFFVIADTLIENRSQQNPVSMRTNYYLHHWQIISASLFAPAVMFTTDRDDEVIEILTKPTALGEFTLLDDQAATVKTDGTGTVTRARLYDVDVPVTGTGTQGVRWDVEGATSLRTTVSSTGVLRVGWDEGAATLTIRATTSGLDDTNLKADAITKTFTVGVTGAIIPQWPTVGTVKSVHVLGQVIPYVQGTNNYTVTSSDTTWDDADIEAVYVSTEGSVSVSKSAAAKVLTVKVDTGRPGAELTLKYTLTAPPAS